jgi:hypothetical protein
MSTSTSDAATQTQAPTPATADVGSQTIERGPTQPSTSANPMDLPPPPPPSDRYTGWNSATTPPSGASPWFLPSLQPHPADDTESSPFVGPHAAFTDDTVAGQGPGTSAVSLLYNPPETPSSPDRTINTAANPIWTRVQISWLEQEVVRQSLAAKKSAQLVSRLTAALASESILTPHVKSLIEHFHLHAGDSHGLFSRAVGIEQDLTGKSRDGDDEDEESPQGGPPRLMETDPNEVLWGFNVPR